MQYIQCLHSVTEETCFLDKQDCRTNALFSSSVWSLFIPTFHFASKVSFWPSFEHSPEVQLSNYLEQCSWVETKDRKHTSIGCRKEKRNSKWAAKFSWSLKIPFPFLSFFSFVLFCFLLRGKVLLNCGIGLENVGVPPYSVCHINHKESI